MKAIVYYTDNNIDPEIRDMCIEQLESVNIPIVSVSFEPMDLGENICVGEQVRCDKTIFWQIARGAAECMDDVVYLAEHDVLYHPSHFDFIPLRDDTLYYNTNRYRWRLSDDKKWFWKSSNIAGRSQIVGRGRTIRDHYQGNMAPKQTFKSEGPNIDIRHNRNFTRGKKPRRFVETIPCWEGVL